MFDKLYCLHNKCSPLLFQGIIYVFALVCLSGCAGKNQPQFPPETDEKSLAIHVVIYHGHSGIIIANKDIPLDLRRLVIAFKDHRFVEFGWGDNDFYRTPEVNAYIAIKAALLPSFSRR